MTSRTHATAKTKKLVVDVSAHGRDEMNLADFPLATLNDRLSDDVKTLVFQDAHGTVTVAGTEKDGLPSAIDIDVIIALLQYTKIQNDFTNPVLRFSRYEVLHLLGWPIDGRSYERLNEALNRWMGVVIFYDGTWWDAASKQYGDAKIHIIEDVVILKGRMKSGNQQDLPLSSFRWNQRFFANCQAGNLKRLDTKEYFSLKSYVSKRLYRFLDKRFYRRADWVLDLDEIAFERVGLSRSFERKVGKIKEKLLPALQELESIGFLEPMANEERYFKEKKDWKIRLNAARKVETPAVPPAEKGPPPALAVELTTRGVTDSTAAELVERHPSEQIAAKIETFDWLVEKKDKRIAKSPAGYLVKSIQDNYATPKGFVSTAERAKLKSAAEAKQQAAEAARRQEREKAEREQKEARLLREHWESLSPEEQAAIDAQSKTQTSAEDLARENGTGGKTFQWFRREAYLRPLLQAAGKLPADA